jgi:hypothetical protein
MFRLIRSLLREIAIKESKRVVARSAAVSSYTNPLNNTIGATSQNKLEKFK